MNLGVPLVGPSAALRFVRGHGGRCTEMAIPDAPLGSMVTVVSGCTWLETAHVPISTTEDYLCEGWLKWMGDGDPKVQYPTAYEWDWQGENLAPQGHSFWYYHTNGLKLPTATWVHLKWIMGPTGSRHSPDAKFMSVGVGVNYTEGTGTMQLCGWSITKLVRL
ncbi:hypothetical protein Pelo_3898 [Pelomyxa schiedti]|nr:hypothetical protein Pelo_3898 [Pelomyxa schiedti]